MKRLATNFPELSILAGADPMMKPLLEAGGAGCITATSNIAARHLRTVFDGFASPAAAAAVEAAQAHIVAQRNISNKFPQIPTIKAMVGYRYGDPSWDRVRHPFVALTEAQRVELGRLLDDPAAGFAQGLSGTFATTGAGQNQPGSSDPDGVRTGEAGDRAMTSVVSLGGPLTDAAAAILEQAGVRVCSTESYPSKAEARTLLEREQPEGVVIRLVERMDEELMRASGRLKVIAKHGAGTEDIDVDAARRLGIPVLAAVGCNARSVAEHALALMLALAKDLRRQDGRVRRGEWDKKRFPGFEVAGRRLGLVGFGQIAQHLAQLGSAVGLEVAAFDPFMPDAAFAAVKRVTELDALLGENDFISLHTPLTPGTRGLIGARELKLMGSRAFLINTARGEVVDEAALVEALGNGTIAGAGLDIFAAEPPGDANPLWALDNVIVSPHCAGVTGEARARVSTVTATNVLAVMSGRPIERHYFVR